MVHEPFIIDENSPMAKTMAEREMNKERILNAELRKIEEFYDICMKHRFGTKENGYSNDYMTGTTCGNIVGDRLKFILKEEKMTVKGFAEKSGVSRSSLIRFLDEKNPDVPKASTIKKIIDALPCCLDDFLYSPDDFKKWIRGYDVYTVHFEGDLVTEYEIFKSLSISWLSLPVVYKDEDEDKKYQMPPHILELLSKQIFYALETTDALLEYEKTKRKPKGCYETPVESLEVQSIKNTRWSAI